MKNSERFAIKYTIIIFSSKVGGGFFFFINTWMIAIALDDKLVTSYNLIASIIPSIVFSHLIGFLCDKYYSVFFCIIADSIRLCLLITLFFITRYNMLSQLNSFSLSFIFYLMNELQQIAWRATISKKFFNNNLLSFNAISIIGGQSGVIIGAASAGFISFYFGYAWLLIISASLYLLSTVTSYLSIKELQGDTCESVEIVSKSFDINVFKYVLSNTGVILLYSLMLLNVAVLYLINSTLAPFLKTVLGLNEKAFSIIDATYSLGSVIGGYLIAILYKRNTGRIVVKGTFIMMALSLLFYGSSSGMIMASVCYFFIGFCSQNSLILLTCAQKITATSYQARVYSLFNTIAGVVGLAIYSLSYVIIKYSLYREVFVISSLIILTICIYVFMKNKDDVFNNQ